MTLPASGIMTAEMINLEMQRSANAPLSFNDPDVRRLAGKTTPGTPVLMSDFYGKTFEYVAVTTGNHNKVSAQSFFTTAQWNSGVPKRLINYHVIYSDTAATPALTSGTGRGGLLVIENRGSILGGPGAPNSGTGGDAFRTDQSGVTIQNYGAIFAGGGGGGKGGNGGMGVWYSGRTVSQTYGQFSPAYYVEWYNGSGVNGLAYWAGVNVALGGEYSAGSFFAGSEGDSVWYKQITRTYTVYDVPNYTSGGPGGNGGWGTGYTGGGSTAGLGGSGGGINAGIGGTGGAGGGWGLSGATGNTGASGNYTGGSGGSGGGLAGRAIFNNGATATLVALTGSDVRGR